MAQLPTAILAALGVAASVRPATAQCPDGTPPPCAAAAGRAPAPRSIAVLTFENVTRDTAAQYLAEGLADQILTRLGSVGRLTVVSRTVVRRLRNADQLSVQQIGRALNAAYLVNGTVRAAGGRMRVSVEALRSTSGEAIWAQTFDRASDSLLGIEEAVATEVAAGVAGRLSPQERRALGSRVTASSRAYEQFLRGNVLMARRSPAALRDAIVAYQNATAADTGFADAFGRLAYASALCDTWSCRGDTESLLGLSREASERALRLDPRSSDAWMGRGYLLERAWHGDSLPASLAAFRRALALDPRNAEAWHQYGSILQYVSDSASVDALRHALALDPARAISYSDLAVTYYAMGRNDRALALIDSAVALEPDGPFRAWRTLFRLTAGDTAGAVADARSSAGLVYFPARGILAVFGHDSAAVRAMDAYATPSRCGQFAALYILWTGGPEQAVRHLLGCGPSLNARWFLRFPVFAPLADDPRIRALRAASDSVLARARWL